MSEHDDELIGTPAESMGEILGKLGVVCASVQIRYEPADGSDREPEPGEAVRWSVDVTPRDTRPPVTVSIVGSANTETSLQAVIAAARAVGLHVRVRTPEGEEIY